MRLNPAFPSTLSIVGGLAVVAVAMFALAFAGFQHTWGHAPDASYVVFSIISAPLALPHSFAEVFLGPTNPGGTVFTITIPWFGVFGLLLFGLFLTRRAIFFILTAIMLLLSSWQWFVVGAGLSGI